jgi:hypothetical protein
MNFNLPKHVGCYIINNELNFCFYKKPNIFHRFMTKILLGWKWKCYKEENK